MTYQVPLIQAGFLGPILNTLEDAGVSMKPILREASLDRFRLSDKEIYIPAQLVYRMLGCVRRREGIDHFVEVFSDQIEIKGMCDWGDIVACAPDLLSAINFATEFDNVILTHERMGLDIDGPVCRFWYYYLDQAEYLERPQPGRNFTDYSDFCLTWNFFKNACGPDWKPLELHLQSREAPDLDNLLPGSSETRIYLGQPATAFVFPTALLTKPLNVRDSGSQAGTFPEPPETLSAAIETLLSSSRKGQVANFKVMANMLDLSQRTLSRRLVDENTTFSDILDSWRFKSSLDLLGQDNVRIRDISEQLGYANAPNFERAFRRWTGTTPGSYRDLLS